MKHIQFKLLSFIIKYSIVFLFSESIYAQVCMVSYKFEKHEKYFDLKINFEKARKWKINNFKINLVEIKEEEWKNDIWENYDFNWLFSHHKSETYTYRIEPIDISAGAWYNIDIDLYSSPENWLKVNFQEKFKNYTLPQQNLRLEIFRYYKETDYPYIWRKSKPYNDKKIKKIKKQIREEKIHGELVNPEITIPIPQIQYFDFNKIYNEAFPFTTIDLSFEDNYSGLQLMHGEFTIIDIQGAILREEITELIVGSPDKKYFGRAFEIINKHPLKDYLFAPIGVLKENYDNSYSFDYCLNKDVFPVKIYLEQETNLSASFITKKSDGGFALHVRPHPDASELYFKILIEDSENQYDAYMSKIHIPIKKTGDNLNIREIHKYIIKYDRIREASSTLKLD